MCLCVHFQRKIPTQGKKIIARESKQKFQVSCEAIYGNEQFFTWLRKNIHLETRPPQRGVSVCYKELEMEHGTMHIEVFCDNTGKSRDSKFFGLCMDE